MSRNKNDASERQYTKRGSRWLWNRKYGKILSREGQKLGDIS